MKSYTLLPGFLLLALTAAIPVPEPTPPNIPSSSSASTLLTNLIVAPQGPQDGYSRDLFPHWVTIQGECNTRETVLKRDGVSVQTSSTCAATSGSWYSPYDGKTWTLASDLDIDHVVPLSNAWKSGAAAWTTDRRRQFANDLANPQLIAVTDELNQAKGDQGPEEWQPPRTSYRCTYARMWIKVKSAYALTVTASEKSSLNGMLATC
ncbi:secreted protein [Tothia fuscella]|uniref:Secreted protein n=1 Tax=Tothia fuscella TaxID=1048955 RepID=A0A9P4NLQ6_9PEZI|nr:secreted protein [Tothia fuscella]